MMHMTAREFAMKDRVRIYDTDAQGVVHYAGYYRFFTDAFEQFSRTRLGSDLPMANSRIWFVVVESSARYYRPARLGDTLMTHVRAKLSGRKAVRFSFRIMRKRELICDGSIVQVAIDSRRWKAVEVPRATALKIARLGGGLTKRAHAPTS